jgi:hypothetical protein
MYRLVCYFAFVISFLGSASRLTELQGEGVAVEPFHHNPHSLIGTEEPLTTSGNFVEEFIQRNVFRTLPVLNARCSSFRIHRHYRVRHTHFVFSFGWLFLLIDGLTEVVVVLADQNPPTTPPHTILALQILIVDGGVELDFDVFHFGWFFLGWFG